MGIDYYFDKEKLFDAKRFYNEKPRYNFKDSKLKADAIINFLSHYNIRPNIISEFGCGRGDILNCIANSFNIPGIGIDISKYGINLARMEYNHLEFVIADLTNLPIKDKAVDLSILIDIIEHIEIPKILLDESVRSSDFVLIKVPLEFNFWRRILNIFGIFKWEDSFFTVGHLHWWELSDILELLKNYQIFDYKVISLRNRPKFNKIFFLNFLIYGIDKITYILFSPKHYSKFFGGHLLILIKSK
jgi:hypothetical protein